MVMHVEEDGFIWVASEEEVDGAVEEGISVVEVAVAVVEGVIVVAVEAISKSM